jgi:hypothetical protein
MEDLKYSSTILKLGSRWMWVVSFTHRPLYPRGKGPQYSLDRRVGGPQFWSERFGEEKISCFSWESNTDRPARSPSLYRLSYPYSPLLSLTA